MRETYRPVIISWDLRTDLRNKENKLLVLRNKLVGLNNAMDSNELFNQLRAMLVLKMDKLKADANPDDPFYFLQLNENVANAFYDFLYEKKLFASVESLKENE
ncbi:MAG TPA: hypothetical protein VK589_30745 [Chryseolinea sp.]|nr:hypothetical protein [Chryseolinea sp.]